MDQPVNYSNYNWNNHHNDSNAQYWLENKMYDLARRELKLEEKEKAFRDWEDELKRKEKKLESLERELNEWKRSKTYGSSRSQLTRPSSSSSSLRHSDRKYKQTYDRSSDRSDRRKSSEQDNKEEGEISVYSNVSE